MKFTRRQTLRMLGGTALVAAGGRRAWTATEKDPIRVGFMVPLSGPFAQSGKDMWDGFRLYFEEIGLRAAGRRIDLISEDSWVEPAEALTKLRKLAERDRVHVAAGGLLAATGLALQPYVLSQKLPFIVTNAADDLTQRKIIPW
jgi:branched-chain amino acid transport system substrate-binding protein